MKFVKGMDLSTLLELEKCGARYYVDGTEMDILDIMKKYDVDMIRIRLWNNPWSESGESYGAGENDLKTTLAIAKKVTDAGLGVLLNFHYSDFWADPGKHGVTAYRQHLEEFLALLDAGNLEYRNIVALRVQHLVEPLDDRGGEPQADMAAHQYCDAQGAAGFQGRSRAGE